MAEKIQFNHRIVIGDRKISLFEFLALSYYNNFTSFATHRGHTLSFLPFKAPLSSLLPTNAE